jgi:hypothetical protein
VPADLNHPKPAFEQLERDIFQEGGSADGGDGVSNGGGGRGGGVRVAAGVHTIFVCEALMIYLADGAPQELLRECSRLGACHGTASVSYLCVVSRIYESCHLSMSHVTYP